MRLQIFCNINGVVTDFKFIFPNLNHSSGYLSTLPQYVFSASELPSFFPIPQHLEMAFLPAPPRILFFCCLEAPTSPGGETCLADFGKVYQQLNPEVRQKFEENGVRVSVK